MSVRKLEIELEREREERAFQLKKLELELEVKKAEALRVDVPLVPEQLIELNKPVFDVQRNVRLVPPFSEKEVEKYFDHFERVALSLKWPKKFWTLLLQFVFTGKAQDVYSALTLEQSGEYDIVKSAVLHAYELVPEAYRQKFRSLNKNDNCTYVEFAREKENWFDRWCTAMKVTTQEQLRELVLLEEFKHCVSPAVATYLNEHKVSKLSDAAIMTDEFVLTHRGSFSSVSFKSDMSTSSGACRCTHCAHHERSDWPEICPANISAVNSYVSRIPVDWTINYEFISLLHAKVNFYQSMWAERSYFLRSGEGLSEDSAPLAQYTQRCSLNPKCPLVIS